MKKVLTLLMLIPLLFIGSYSVYAQNKDTEQKSNIKAIDDITIEDLNDELDRLHEEKLRIPYDDLENHERIDDEIKNIEDQIDALNHLKERDLKTYLETPFFDIEDFWQLIIKGLFNLLVVLILVRYIYYPITRNKDYLFTYLLISLTVFLLCFFLDNVKIELGFALGLFAIFGIIRYRTDPIPIKEMTYLFLVIGISVVNALANKKISYAELLFANLTIIFVTYGMERLWLLKHESRRNITYEKIDLIVPEKRDELMSDLKERTGLDIIRIEIRRIDFLRDIANIRIFYYEEDSK